MDKHTDKKALTKQAPNSPSKTARTISKSRKKADALQTQNTTAERATRQRAAIREVLIHEARPLTPPEILEKAQSLVPKLGIATVYRNIKAMVDIGELSAVHLPGDRIYYELATCAHLHHHHFRCTTCARVFDVHGCNDGFASLVPQGFIVQSHDLTLYGTCASCNGLN